MDESIRPKTPQEEEVDRIAADQQAAALQAATESTQRAYRTQERRALNLQMNDQSGFYS